MVSFRSGHVLTSSLMRFRDQEGQSQNQSSREMVSIPSPKTPSWISGTSLSCGICTLLDSQFLWSSAVQKSYTLGVCLENHDSPWKGLEHQSFEAQCNGSPVLEVGGEVLYWRGPSQLAELCNLGIWHLCAMKSGFFNFKALSWSLSKILDLCVLAEPWLLDIGHRAPPRDTCGWQSILPLERGCPQVRVTPGAWKRQVSGSSSPP